jgi:hypothetical protein
VDLNLYLRVLWRFRILVVAGLLLAVALALLSYARVNFDGGAPSFSYREDEIWESRSLLLVTEAGFPWGRTKPALESVPAKSKSEPEARVPRFADPGRFVELAGIYVGFAGSDAVRDLMLRNGPLEGAVEAERFTRDGRTFLPIIELTGVATAPERAISTAKRGTKALRSYLAQQQLANKVPGRDRVELAQLTKPETAELVEARKRTRPVAIFLAVLFATLGLAFVLENLRPRVRAVGTESAQSASALDVERRSA